MPENDEEESQKTNHVESDVEHLQDDIEDVRKDQKDYATKSDLEAVKSELLKKVSEPKSPKSDEQKPIENPDEESESVAPREVQKIDVKTEMPDPSYREVRVRIHGRYRTVRVED